MVTFRGSGSGPGPGPWSPGTKTCSSLLNLIITDGKPYGAGGIYWDGCAPVHDRNLGFIIVELGS